MIFCKAFMKWALKCPSFSVKKRTSFQVSFNCFRSYSCIKQSEVTAGILIVGDEILNGQVEDKNMSFLIQQLSHSGIKLNKICIVPDDINTISEEVSSLSRTCTVVLTTGGIGPTHDDVTYEAVAKALSEELVQNEKLTKLYEEYFGPQSSQNAAVMKFSFIPKSAVLNFNTSRQGVAFKFPLISAKNIYMFPGVPMLLRKGFEVFKASFLLHNKPNIVEYIYLSFDEFYITPLLNQAVDLFKGQVKFGSYPSFTDNYYKVKITLESTSRESIDKAVEFLSKQIPQEKVVSLKADTFKSIIEDVSAISQENPSFSFSVSLVEQALKMYDLSEICICFNGGKDCTAMLHLLYYCVKKLGSNKLNKLHAFYVRNGETFREVEDFVKISVKNYNLNFTVVEGDMKTAFFEYLKRHPEIKAAFMGTRRYDPGAELLRYFVPTDDEWPPVMRILPILEWSYSDVWYFIRKLQLPYCILYDRGYTSIGLKEQTVQNPALLISKETKFRSYKPAYMLYNDEDERNSRL